jgi:hypothetical protein
MEAKTNNLERAGKKLSSPPYPISLPNLPKIIQFFTQQG